MGEIKMKLRKQTNKLYKCILKPNIRNLEDSTEYLRCKSKKTLQNMFTQCFGFEHSMYYGYHKVIITEMKMSNFPEVRTVKVKCK